MRSAIVLAASAFLWASVGFAQNQGIQQQFQTDQATFQQWDRDGNGELSREEFMRGARRAGLFNMWDNDNDGRVDRSEFDEIGFSGDFENWDANNSAYLDPNEVYGGVFAANDEDLVRLVSDAEAQCARGRASARPRQISRARLGVGETRPAHRPPRLA